MKAVFFFLMIAWFGKVWATGEETMRTDTFDVVHYDIHLNISNTSKAAISGYCKVKLFSKIPNLRSIDLDLLQLTVDSIQVAGLKTTYTYNDTLIVVHLPMAINVNDTSTVTVYYHGQPVSDGSWGGFYFSGNYAYNMGVGFAADPHSFGRVWFPCVDNFVDKALFDFYITTTAGTRAMCNGLLVGSLPDVQGNTTWHWQTDKPLPPYLASVAVSNYAPVTTTYKGVKNDFPVVLAAPAIDTLNMINTFVHLDAAIAGFEKAYGPQPFEKVGFTEVPFSEGAMEHAGNIACPSFAIDGTINHEDLYVHELSHMWWGDMVTCESEGDMWLNEGWASYSTILFHEFVYGTESYKKAMRANHLISLQYSYISDGGYLSLINVPHANTYGSQVYHKGADVAHTLRSYMGDSAFFSSLKAHLLNHAYANSNSYQFRDDLAASSGQDLNSFFDDWVFHPGFPHFSIDSVTTTSTGGNYTVAVYIKQKLKEAPKYFDHVPLEVSFYKSINEHVTHTIEMSGYCGVYFTSLPFNPVYVGLDMEEKISDARTTKYIMINSKGEYDFEEALMTLDVTSVKDTALVRVEHNWVYPDPLQKIVPGLYISQERYWQVEGIWPPGFQADATISYNGEETSAGGYLDNKLIGDTKEDSLVLLYRPSAKYDWSIYPHYKLDVEGDNEDKKGEIIIHDMQKGEYALAIRDYKRPNDTMVLDKSPCRVLGVPQKAKIQGK